MRSFRIVAPARHISLAEDLLRAEGFEFEPEPFAPDICRRLTAEPFALGESLAAFFGYIYIQDRSSMLPPLLLDPPPGAAVLDMCASPGSKTGLLAQLVGPTGFVLGNEPSRDRLETLRQNLRRMNLPQAATCSYNGERLLLPPESWSCILLDPPCSGWGTVDKNPKVMTLWSADKAESLVRLQRGLLRQAAGLIAPGGRILYSTCTTNPRENEEQAAWAVEELGLAIRPLSPPAGFVFEPAMGGLAGVLRVDQQASDAQGFFLANLEKPCAEPAAISANGALHEPGEPDRTAQSPALIPDRRCGHSDHSDHSGHPGHSVQAGDLGHLGQNRTAHRARKAHQSHRTHRAGLPGRELAPAQLGLEDVFDWSFLPPGRVFDFGSKAFFLPEQAMGLPTGFRWQGFFLGKLAGQILRPQARLRAMLRPDGQAIRLEDPDEIRALLSGRGLKADGHGAYVGLFWRDLPLGVLTRKGRRLLWAGG